MQREAERKSNATNCSSHCHESVTKTTQPSEHNIAQASPSPMPNARDHDAAQGYCLSPFRRQPRRGVRREVDHQTNDDAGFIVRPQDADPSNFDPAGDRLGCLSQEPARPNRDPGSIVAHQAGEHACVPGCREKVTRE